MRKTVTGELFARHVTYHQASSGTTTDIAQEPSADALFHAHLDACDQCRGRPFGLCAEGERLITQTTIGR